MLGGDQAGAEEFSCSCCERSFRTAEQLVVHAKVHRDGPDRPFHCTQCCRTFTRRDKLAEHEAVHRHGKQHCCGICSKGFKTRYSLMEHMRRHEGLRPFTCEHCSKSYYSRTDLRHHVRTHTGERPFQCRMCPLRLIHQADLIRHERTHVGDRPFPCLVCGRRFSRNSILTRHLRGHTGERPFQCTLCPNSFTRAYLLEEHRANHPHPILFTKDMQEERGKKWRHRKAVNAAKTLQKEPSLLQGCSKQDPPSKNSVIGSSREPSTGLAEGVFPGGASDATVLNIPEKSLLQDILGVGCPDGCFLEGSLQRLPQEVFPESSSLEGSLQCLPQEGSTDGFQWEAPHKESYSKHAHRSSVPNKLFLQGTLNEAFSGASPQESPLQGHFPEHPLSTKCLSEDACQPNVPKKTSQKESCSKNCLARKSQSKKGGSKNSAPKLRVTEGHIQEECAKDMWNRKYLARESFAQGYFSRRKLS